MYFMHVFIFTPLGNENKGIKGHVEWESRHSSETLAAMRLRP